MGHPQGSNTYPELRGGPDSWGIKVLFSVRRVLCLEPEMLQYIYILFLKGGKKVKSKGLNVTRSTEIVYLCSEHLSCY